MARKVYYSWSTSVVTIFPEDCSRDGQLTKLLDSRVTSDATEVYSVRQSTTVVPPTRKSHDYRVCLLQPYQLK